VKSINRNSIYKLQNVQRRQHKLTRISHYVFKVVSEIKENNTLSNVPYCAVSYLSEKYERYPLIIRYHLSLFRVPHRYLVVPRQVVGVFDPTVARHELGMRAGEVDRCPTRDWLVQVQHLPIVRKDSGCAHVASSQAV